MKTATISQRRASALPEALRTAQDAIHLPEVQEMLRRLSEYRLGVFLPHMHDVQTGDFQLLPDAVMQVEAGQRVSFQATEEVERQSDRFVPVGWLWRTGAAEVSSVCEMVWDEGSGNTVRGGKHKMIDR